MRCQLLDEMEAKVDAMRKEKDLAQADAYTQRTEKEAARAEVKRVSDLYADAANRRDALTTELERMKGLYADKVDAYMKEHAALEALRAEHAEALATLDKYEEERRNGVA